MQVCIIFWVYPERCFEMCNCVLKTLSSHKSKLLSGDFFSVIPSHQAAHSKLADSELHKWVLSGIASYLEWFKAQKYTFFLLSKRWSLTKLNCTALYYFSILNLSIITSTFTAILSNTYVEKKKWIGMVNHIYRVYN